MKKLILLLALVGCDSAPKIKVVEISGSWFCNADVLNKHHSYEFTGADAEQRAHDKCNALLPAFQQTNMEKTED